MRVIGLAGWSGAGKTTLIVKLIPFLRERGFSVSTLKHAHPTRAAPPHLAPHRASAYSTPR